MSCNREHIVWQSPDKTWNIGFYSYTSVNTDDPDFDYEWDVEYDYSEFYWVSSGHSTVDNAQNAWVSANPGSPDDVVMYRRGSTTECKALDEMAKCYRSPEYAEKKRLKTARAQVRAAAKTVEATIAEDRFTAGSSVEVMIGDASMYRILTGSLIHSGDWLVLREGTKEQKVYNTRTKKAWIGTRHNMPVGIRSVRRQDSRFNR